VPPQTRGRFKRENATGAFLALSSHHTARPTQRRAAAGGHGSGQAGLHGDGDGVEDGGGVGGACVGQRLGVGFPRLVEHAARRVHQLDAWTRGI